MIVSPTPANIEKAAALLIAGDLVSFPTETVYGLGGDATNAAAVGKIFEVKGRPTSNPLIVHIKDIEMLESVGDFADRPGLLSKVLNLSSLWPGPLSLVIPRNKALSKLVSGSSPDTVAVRIPDHPIALELLRTVAKPIAAPSANLSGHISPTLATHVERSLGEKVSLILDGGACRLGLESTVVSLISDRPVILRPGGITKELLEEKLGESVSYNIQHLTADSVHLSPGSLLKHYAPSTETCFADDLKVPFESTARVGALWFSESPPPIPCSKVVQLSSSRNPDEIAPLLFNGLRELDEANLDLIILDRCAEVGLGIAIMDRLRRASAS